MYGRTQRTPALRVTTFRPSIWLVVHCDFENNWAEFRPRNDGAGSDEHTMAVRSPFSRERRRSEATPARRSRASRSVRPGVSSAAMPASAAPSGSPPGSRRSCEPAVRSSLQRQGSTDGWLRIDALELVQYQGYRGGQSFPRHRPPQPSGMSTSGVSRRLEMDPRWRAGPILARWRSPGPIVSSPPARRRMAGYRTADDDRRDAVADSAVPAHISSVRASSMELSVVAG